MRIKQLHFFTWIILSLLISIQWSCTVENTTSDEPKKVDVAKQIAGDWVITAAEKSGKSTVMLEGAYFKFQPESKMATNITGSEITYDIDVKDKVIQQKGNVEIFYTVESIQDTTMVLTFNMQGYAFKLNLTKS